MNIEISNIDIALLNGLIASRQCILEVNLANCSAIEDKGHQKSAKESVKKEIKQLEELTRKINLWEDAVPNTFWGRKGVEV
jgi:hypothetical protein